MKPVNWISATGFRPAAAIPMATPAIPASASGVSMTRSAPKRACKPTVARNTPPFTPTSSPRTTTSGSRAISPATARLTASTRLTSAMSIVAAARKASRFVALRFEHRRQGRVEAVEHGVGTRRRNREIIVDRAIDPIAAFALERFFLVLVPGADAGEVIAQADDGLERPLLADDVGVAIAGGVVGRRVVAQPVGQRLDQRGPAAR